MLTGVFEDKYNVFDNDSHIFRSWMVETINNGFIINLHWHHHIEMIFCVEGNFIFQLEREVYTVEKGDFALILPRQDHALQVPEGITCKYIVISFRTELIYSALLVLQNKCLLPFIVGNTEFTKLLRNNMILETRIPELSKHIYCEYNSSSFGYELAVKILIEQLLLEILRFYQTSTPNLERSFIKQSESELMKRVLDYIFKNYANKLNIEAVAKEFGMSYSHFARVFRKLTGRTFLEFVIHIRISEAVRLLMSTDLPITQIALDTGFASSSHLISHFKRVKGMSPLQFKRYSQNNKTKCFAAVEL